MKKFQHLTVNLNPHVANMVLVTNQENTVVAQFQVSFEIIFAKKKKEKKSKIFRENRYHFKVCQYGH